MAMLAFRDCAFGMLFTPSEARNGKVRLYIKCLGGKASDSEHFVMHDYQAGSKSESNTARLSQ